MDHQLPSDLDDQPTEDHIHLPPNSLVPIAVALSLTVAFTGLLIPLKVHLGSVIIPIVSVVGLLMTVASLTAWVRGARREFHDLP